MTGVSIYCSAGDFSDAIHRYQNGLPQIFHSHDELARLASELIAAGYQVTFYSYVTPEQVDIYPQPGVRFVGLGAKSNSASTLLRRAVEDDQSDIIIPHFPNIELLSAVAKKKCRAMVICAHSFTFQWYRVRATIRKYITVNLLNNPRFDLVANHCFPSTEHLATIGVKRKKLIAYDAPHSHEPTMYPVKKYTPRDCVETIYVGSITDGKGVLDIIRAVSLLNSQGMRLRCTLVGAGEIDRMMAEGRRYGISNYLSFVGLVDNSRIPELLSAADIVLIPSRRENSEGFPFTMFEAIASRTPIVCSDHPMFKPIMIDGVNAGVFASGSYTALAAAIQRTLSNSRLYEQYSSNADSTWKALQGTADWRTMIMKWIQEGPESLWIEKHLFINRRIGG